MTETKNARGALACGAWPSTLSPELAAAGVVSLSYATAAGGSLYWIEGRPEEKGRSAWMCRPPTGEIFELKGEPGPPVNVRSRVHEYGGLPYLVAGEKRVYASFADQRLRMLDALGQTTVLTPEGCRYADGCAAPDGHRLVLVREDHRAADPAGPSDGPDRTDRTDGTDGTDGPDGSDGPDASDASDPSSASEARNAVVMLDLNQPGGAGQLLYGDSDFVAWPRLSNDGQRLAFIAWNHPHMPWDSTKLIVGDLLEGRLVNPQVVAGAADESVLEPRWDIDGSLCFLSDRSGHWRLVRWREGVVEAL